MSEQQSPEREWTVLELLRWTTQHFAERGIESARLDAELLLAHALGCERLRLYVDFEKPTQEEERARFRELVQRRARDRVPVAQLLGRREFWSLELEVTPEVLVPRPETETLVEAALALAPGRDGELRVLDLGTGSGAVALAFASERPKARVIATDVSPAALEVARRNAERHALADRVHFLAGDGFAPVAGERFDLVLSNPPYVAERDAASLAPELAHEPASALFAGPDGTALLRRIAEQAEAHLEPAGVLVLELAPEQVEPLRGWLAEAGLVASETRRDLAGHERVLCAARSEKALAKGEGRGES